MDNSKGYHAPLHSLDTMKRTFGCRHYNPDNCGKNCLPGICAFDRDDGMCLSPPKSWPKQYKKLKELAEGKAHSAVAQSSP